jgi:hypothetical protein
MRKLWFRRKAVSSMIGGIIILSIFLTSLGAMVVVSQQYSIYQNTVNLMSQNDIDRYSERLIPVDPGLIYSLSNPVSGCGGTCNLYYMLLSNDGGVGVQVARIYVNSTGQEGCTPASGLCVLNPSTTSSPTAYTFSASDMFLNTGESNHTLRLWFPSTIGHLPPNTGANMIWIVTTRGRIFTLQWPLLPNPLAKPGTIPDLLTGVTKIAYTGTYSSQNEGSGSGYCHTETKETTTNPYGSSFGNLYFVNPWITETIMQDATKSNTTQVWISALLNNTTHKTLTVNNGAIILEVADAASDAKQYFVGASYLGGVYPISSVKNQTQTTITVPNNPDAQFIVIFKVTFWEHDLQTNPGIGNAAGNGDIFQGTGSANNALGTNAEDSTYTSIFFFLEGFYLKVQC